MFHPDLRSLEGQAEVCARRQCLLAVPEWVVLRVVRVKLMLWRFQEVEDVRNVGHLPEKAVGRECSQPQRPCGLQLTMP